jgi:hypothetical protein
MRELNTRSWTIRHRIVHGSAGNNDIKMLGFRELLGLPGIVAF